MLISQERLTSQLPRLSGFTCWMFISYSYRLFCRCSWEQVAFYGVVQEFRFLLYCSSVFVLGPASPRERTCLIKWNTSFLTLKQNIWNNIVKKKKDLVSSLRGFFPLEVGPTAFGWIVRQDIMVESCEGGGCSPHDSQEVKVERKRRAITL